MTACARRVRGRASRGIPKEELELVKKVLASIQKNLRNHKLVGESVA
jgi:hypothetical protein